MDAPRSSSRPSSVPQSYEIQASKAQSASLSHWRCLGERSQQPSLGMAASYPEGLEQGGGHTSMGAGSD